MIRSLSIFYLLLIITLLCPLSVGAIPGTLTHQGRIIDSDNNPMSGIFSVTFALYEQAESGSAIWNETLDIVFDDGDYSVVLGTENALTLSDFSSDTLFLSVTLQGSNEMEPRYQLTSVPFVFRAGEVTGRVDAEGGLFVDGEQVINSNGAWIGGEVQVAPTTAQCTNSTAGTLRWNDNENRLEVCDGSSWSVVGTGSGSDPGGVPSVTSVTPGQIEPQTNVELTINGDNFDDGSEVFIGDHLSPSVTAVSSSEITADTGTNILSGAYFVRVINSAGLRDTLYDGLIIDGAPIWETPAGDLGIIVDAADGPHFTLETTDPENQDVTYTLLSGTLPPGVELSADTGILSGNPDDVEGATEFTFAIRATDTAPTPNQSDQTFSINVMHRLGVFQDIPGESCDHILYVDSTAPDDIYWIDPNGGDTNDAFQVYCDMTSDGGGWMLLLTLTHPNNQFSGSVHPLIQNLNETSPSVTEPYARDWRPHFTPVEGTQFMIKRGTTGDWSRFRVTSWCGWDSTDAGVCTGGHGTYASGCVYEEDGSAISCTNSWLNSCSNTGGCQSSGCDTLGFNVNHDDYAAAAGTDGASKLFGSGWHGDQCYGAWDTTTSQTNVFPQTAWMREAFSQDDTARSCAELKDRGNDSDGAYTIDPDGDGGKEAFQTYCDMTTGGGGWTLLINQTHPRDDFPGSVHPLVQNLNEDTPSLTDAYARNWYGVYHPVNGTEFMIKRGTTGQWARFTVETWCGWNTTSEGVCDGGHGTYSRGCVHDSNGDLLSCDNTWFNSCSNDGGCQSSGCDTLGFNINHGDYAGAYSGTQLFGAGWHTPQCYGAWGTDFNQDNVFPQSTWIR